MGDPGGAPVVAQHGLPAGEGIPRGIKPRHIILLCTAILVEDYAYAMGRGRAVRYADIEGIPAVHRHVGGGDRSRGQKPRREPVGIGCPHFRHHVVGGASPHSPPKIDGQAACPKSDGIDRANLGDLVEDDPRYVRGRYFRHHRLCPCPLDAGVGKGEIG